MVSGDRVTSRGIVFFTSMKETYHIKRDQLAIIPNESDSINIFEPQVIRSNPCTAVLFFVLKIQTSLYL